jgi:RHS repeat-associated protein
VGRHDVVAVITDSGGAGGQVEQIRYSAYGIPFGLPAGDADSSGDVDAGDVTTITNWANTSHYDVRGDLNLDGVVDAADVTLAQAMQGTTLGWKALSHVGGRKGYAGYEACFSRDTLWHVRHRVLESELGRWTRRDPLGYVDGVSLYQYVGSAPTSWLDSQGLTRQMFLFDGWLGSNLLEVWWRPLLLEFGDVHWFRYNESWAALALARTLAEYKEPDPANPCKCRGHTFLVFGHSFGAWAASDVARTLTRQDGIPIELGFTADPRSRGPAAPFGWPPIRAYGKRWVNFYQSLYFPHGQTIDGAENHRVNRQVFEGEGFWPGVPHNDIVKLNYVRGAEPTPEPHSANLINEVGNTEEWREVPCD